MLPHHRPQRVLHAAGGRSLAPQIGEGPTERPGGLQQRRLCGDARCCRRCWQAPWRGMRLTLWAH